MPTRLKIRGIYSTALTRLALEGGYGVVEPSARICERFRLDPCSGPEEILVLDKDDLQGVQIRGQPEHVCQLLTFLQERLLDPVLLLIAPVEAEENLVEAMVEFPGASKQILDTIRTSVTPTLTRHHRFRIIDAKALERAENTLCRRMKERDAIAASLFRETVTLPLEKAGTVKMEHIRPCGRSIRPREGVLVKAEGCRIVFRRAFQKGRYDGLDIPIQHGDYGVTEIVEGAWCVKHCYFTGEGKAIGEYYNINTPVELYPYGARYLDLEIDVVHRAGEAPGIVDRENLALLVKRGGIGPALEARAVQTAEEILRDIENSATGPCRNP